MTCINNQQCSLSKAVEKKCPGYYFPGQQGQSTHCPAQFDQLLQTAALMLEQVAGPLSFLEAMGKQEIETGGHWLF